MCALHTHVHAYRMSDNYLMCGILEVLLKMAMKKTKTGVFANVERVNLNDMIALCPALAFEENLVHGARGLERRTAELDLTKCALFHRFCAASHGLGRTDTRGDSWFVIGAVVQHVAPPITSVKAPYVRLVCEVCASILTLCAGVCIYIYMYEYISPHRRHARLAGMERSDSIWASLPASSSASTGPCATLCFVVTSKHAVGWTCSK